MNGNLKTGRQIRKMGLTYNSEHNKECITSTLKQKQNGGKYVVVFVYGRDDEMHITYSQWEYHPKVVCRSGGKPEESWSISAIRPKSDDHSSHEDSKCDDKNHSRHMNIGNLQVPETCCRPVIARREGPVVAR